MASAGLEFLKLNLDPLEVVKMEETAFSALFLVLLGTRLRILVIRVSFLLQISLGANLNLSKKQIILLKYSDV